MQKSSIKIIFFGTSEFAVPALETLKSEGYDIVAVVATPDEPTGRKQILTPPPIKTMANRLGLIAMQPEKLKGNPAIVHSLSSLGPNLGIVAAYGKVIPKEIIDLLKFGILNIHPSLLPKYRGSSPIQSALLNGEKTTGVTIMKIDEELDHGPIVAQEKLEIRNEYYPELHDKLAKMGAKLLTKILPDYFERKIKPVPQNHDEATFTKLLKTGDGEIKLNDTAERAYNKIRALNPDPGAYVWLEKNGKKMRLKILAAELSGRRLELKIVQPEGRKPMEAGEFIKGYPKLLPNWQ